jgi:hypothetical protein
MTDVELVAMLADSERWTEIAAAKMFGRTTGLHIDGSREAVPKPEPKPVPLAKVLQYKPRVN